MSATRNNETGKWDVKLSESDQAQKDFGRVGDAAITYELELNDRELATLLYLATNDEDNGMVTTAMYGIIEPKLVNVPMELRPIP